jgi:hypothetical protein
MIDELPVLLDRDFILIPYNCNDSISEADVSSDSRNRMRTFLRNEYIGHTKKHRL